MYRNRNQSQNHTTHHIQAVNNYAQIKFIVGITCLHHPHAIVEKIIKK